jgi:glutaredoxin
MNVVDLYGKEDCCLCDDARAALERLRGELGFELREHDIERDEALLRAYFERIPVVVVDGEELCCFYVDEPLLRARLERIDHLESRA